MKRLMTGLLCAALITPTTTVLLEQGKVRADSSGAVAEDASGDFQITIDENNFPDDVFRDYVLRRIDTAEPKGKLSREEIMAVESIVVAEYDIQSLKGIEFFTYLEYLDCYGTSLKELDLTSNANLNWLECDYIDSLTSLKVSGLSKLEHLECDHTSVVELDLTGCIAVRSFDCKYCKKLESVNRLQDCQQLTSVEFTGNDALTSVDVSGCVSLKDFVCDGLINLKSVDVSGCDSLFKVVCVECDSLTELDVSGLTQLEILSCYGCPITKLKIRNNPKLRCLCADNIPLKEFELYSCPMLLKLLSLGLEPEQSDYPNKNGETMLYWEVESYLDDANGVSVYCFIDFDEDDIFITEEPSYSVSVTSDGNGTASASVTSAKEDATVTLVATPNAGYVFKEWLVVSGGVVIADVKSPSTTFVMRDENVQIKALFREPTFEDFIERMYVVALGRSSEADGKAFWMNKVKNEGFTGGRVAIGFLIEAPEFLNRNLSDSDFVDVLYKTFFDRAADADGKAFWLGHLASDMTREQVVRGFIDSTEWCNLCAFYGVKSGAPNEKAENPSANALKFATRLYTECLGREPDADGLLFWALRLTNLESSGYEAARGFFESTEFVNKNVDDTTYVKLLYRTFMGRDYDQGGLEFWLGHLSTDMNRLQVLQGFAQSQEFTNICNDYGIDRGTI